MIRKMIKGCFDFDDYHQGDKLYVSTHGYISNDKENGQYLLTIRSDDIEKEKLRVNEALDSIKPFYYTDEQLLKQLSIISFAGLIDLRHYELAEKLEIDYDSLAEVFLIAIKNASQEAEGMEEDGFYPCK